MDPPLAKAGVRQSRHHIIKGKKGRCVVVKQEKGDGKKTDGRGRNGGIGEASSLQLCETVRGIS